MTFRWAWSWPALTAFYDLHVHTATAVDRAVLDFTRDRAPHLPSGRYRLVAGGCAIRVRVDATFRTVLVLYVVRL